LADRGKVLHSLNTPKLGDSLLRPDGTPWMTTLAHQAPKINWDDLAQTPALPLGSWLKTDPWDDKVHTLNARFFPPMNPRDKMPLEVTPVYFRLQRYNTANVTPPAQSQAAPTPAADPNPPPAPNPNAAPAGAPAAGQAAPASPQANPAAPPQVPAPNQDQQSPPTAEQPATGDTTARQQPPASPQQSPTSPQ
jgi:hypothetical protein